MATKKTEEVVKPAGLKQYDERVAKHVVTESDGPNRKRPELTHPRSDPKSMPTPPKA
jgi:hypothetical protein